MVGYELQTLVYNETAVSIRGVGYGKVQHRRRVRLLAERVHGVEHYCVQLVD